MSKFSNWISRIYRSSLSYSKQRQMVWKDLKMFFVQSEFHHGVYEKDKFIETGFEIDENRSLRFMFYIYEGDLCCCAEIWSNFPAELTTDMFILAMHFNNALNYGKIIINIDDKTVIYSYKKTFLAHLLYRGEIHRQVSSHREITYDLYFAFKKLVEENEEPALIFADFLRMKEKQNEETNHESG